jgi:hypothetical protein
MAGLISVHFLTVTGDLINLGVLCQLFVFATLSPVLILLNVFWDDVGLHE